MSKKTQTHAQILKDLSDLLSEDIFEMPDDEVWETIERTGRDPDTLVSRMRASTRKLLSADTSETSVTSAETREEVSKLISEKMKGYYRFKTAFRRATYPLVRCREPQRTFKAIPCSPASVPQGMKVSGSIVANGESLVIDGEVEGDVRGLSVTIGKTGVVKGNIVAGMAVVHGRVRNVCASKVLLVGDARVSGDVTVTAGGGLSGATVARRSTQRKGRFFVGNLHPNKD
jgi:cytoskeletal protein CcmA (bactofilin family)